MKFHKIKKKEQKLDEKMKKIQKDYSVGNFFEFYFQFFLNTKWIKEGTYKCYISFDRARVVEHKYAQENLRKSKLE